MLQTENGEQNQLVQTENGEETKLDRQKTV